MKIKSNVGLHNEFRLERRKAIFNDDGTWSPGELVQEVFGYNLILNQGLLRIRDIFTTLTSSANTARVMRPISDTSINADRRFGGYIHVGSGSGTLGAERTTLFNSIGSYYTGFHEREISWAEGWASYTQVYTIQPQELVGQNITEVGLGAFTNFLSTHSLLEDSEGNPISIINKSNTEVVVIYAKVYLQIGTAMESPYFSAGLQYAKNPYLIMVYQNGRVNIQRNGLFTGTSTDSIDTTTNNGVVSNHPNNPDGFVGWGAFAISKNGTVATFSRRLGTADSNGKIKEIGASGLDVRDVEFDTAPNQHTSLFRQIIVGSAYGGHTITDELIGTGNGTQTVFTAAWDEWNANAVTVKVNNVVVSTGFTIDRTAGTITFDSPVTNGHEVKVTYSVDYIPKDEQHVVDVSFEWHFTDANAV